MICDYYNFFYNPDPVAHLFFSVTPALNNMERSGMLFNVCVCGGIRRIPAVNKQPKP